MSTLHNHQQDTILHEDCPRCRLNSAAPELLEAIENLRHELNSHIKFDVKKHYSLMVADVVADKAIRKARGASCGT